MILLFVLSKFGQPIKIEELRQDLTALIAKREEELHVIRGDVQVLNRELEGKKEQLSREKESLARLQGDLSKLQGEFAASQQNAAVQNTIEGKLAQAQQELTEEMKRLQKDRPRVSDGSVGGIPTGVMTHQCPDTSSYPGTLCGLRRVFPVLPVKSIV